MEILKNIGRKIYYYDNKYVAFLCGFLMMGAAGTEYMFSTYAPQLKTLMNYTQTQINFLGTMGNMGIYMGFYLGILHDFTNARIISFIGTIMLFLGWYLLYLGSISFFPTNYLVMACFMFIQGNGSAACYTASISNIVPKFSGKSRGTVVGLLVSMFGLTSAIFSPIYEQVFDSNVQNFLLFFAVTLPMVSFLGVIFLAPPSSQKKSDDLQVVYEDNDDDDHRLLKQNQKKDELNMSKSLIDDDNTVINYNNQVSGESPKKKEKEWEGVAIKQELNSLQILKSFDFYLIFTICMLGTGVGITLFNNLGSLIIAMGGESSSWLVTLLSLSNCGGRLLFGFSSDLLIRTRLISRSGCLLIGLVLMAASEAYFVIYTTKDNVIWLIPGVVMLGISYGALLSLSPALVNEFLGTKYFGGNWGIVRASPAVSGFVLSTLIAGKLYEYYVVGDSTECFGWYCYGWSFIVNFFVVLLTIIACIILMIRWRLFERSLRSQ